MVYVVNRLTYMNNEMVKTFYKWKHPYFLGQTEIESAHVFMILDAVIFFICPNIYNSILVREPTKSNYLSLFKCKEPFLELKWTRALKWKNEGSP